MWVYILVATIICGLYLTSGVKEIYKGDSRSKALGIGYLIGGTTFGVGLILYFLTLNEWHILMWGTIHFYLTGSYGIFNRKKLKNSLLTRIDISYIVYGLICTVPLYLYFVGYFDK